MPTAQIEDFVRSLLEDYLYFSGSKSSIPWLWKPGACPLFLVLGPNAGGKSLFRKLLTQVVQTKKPFKEVIHTSMQGRASEGVLRAFIYGSEDWQATGEITCSTVTKAIATCRERTHEHLLYWDEPDLGLSEEACAGVGLEVVSFMEDLPSNTKGVFLTTHSRELARRLAPLNPHYLHLGVKRKEAPKSLEAWIEREIVPVSPEAVREASCTRFREINKLQNRRKKAS